MKLIAWVGILGALAAIGYALWIVRRQWLRSKQVAEARLASFVAQSASAKPAAVPPPAVPPPTALPPAPEQRLLFEAAGKAAQAGEPALAIQLYARLLSRFPDTPLAGQARASVAAQKEKLARISANG